MGEWWISETGQNMLGGDPDDPDDPIALPDEVVVDFLLRIPAARDSFNRLYPQMTNIERIRLDRLSTGVAANLALIPKAVHDTFQATFNKAGVYTAGPRGGQRIGGN